MTSCWQTLFATTNNDYNYGCGNWWGVGRSIPGLVAHAWLKECFIPHVQLLMHCNTFMKSKPRIIDAEHVDTSVMWAPSLPLATFHVKVTSKWRNSHNTMYQCWDGICMSRSHHQHLELHTAEAGKSTIQTTHTFDKRYALRLSPWRRIFRPQIFRVWSVVASRFVIVAAAFLTKRYATECLDL